MIKSRVFVVVRSQGSSEDVRLSNRVGKMKDRKQSNRRVGRKAR
jgi:hypothetical protein